MIGKIIERIIVTRKKHIEGVILGEIKSIASDTGDMTLITLDETAILEALKRYGKEQMTIDKIKEQVLEKSKTCGRRSGNLSVKEILEILEPFDEYKQQTVSKTETVDWKQNLMDRFGKVE